MSRENNRKPFVNPFDRELTWFANGNTYAIYTKEYFSFKNEFQ